MAGTPIQCEDGEYALVTYCLSRTTPDGLDGLARSGVSVVGSTFTWSNWPARRSRPGSPSTRGARGFESGHAS
jgi:hypothetical protein